MSENGKWVFLTDPEDVLRPGDQVRYRMIDGHYDHWQLADRIGEVLAHQWGAMMSGYVQFRRWVKR